MCQLDGGYLDRLGPFLPLLDLELNALVLLKRAKAAPLELGIVDEEILPSVVRGDETEALFAVEPFHSSLRHLLIFSHSADAPKNPAQRTRMKRRKLFGCQSPAPKSLSRGWLWLTQRAVALSQRQPDPLCDGRNRHQGTATLPPSPWPNFAAANPPAMRRARPCTSAWCDVPVRAARRSSSH